MAAVEPGAAVARALEGSPPPERPLHLLAFGKAAPAMSRAAARWVAEHGGTCAGGIVVAPGEEDPGIGSPSACLAPLEHVSGDHPVPAAGSRRAAEAVGRAVSAVGHRDAVMVLLSGGTSSLIAAPAPGVSDADLDRMWHLLLGSGLDIHATNAVRRRFTRWGGGRLAVALGGRRIDVLAISDVPGDDPAAIGSGPCAADPFTAEDIERLLDDAGLLSEMPRRLTALLREKPAPARTVPPGDRALADVHTRIIASNADAVRAAAARARALGWRAGLVLEPLTGEAAVAGTSLAERLIAGPPERLSVPRCTVAGGETTVSLGPDTSSARLGGRCQELALAAAQVLAANGAGDRVALLAAGTDGRDGPTDAAGAIVDGTTWQRIAAAGRVPAADLARHDSYPALDAAGALLRTGATGTNVMDVVIGLRS